MNKKVGLWLGALHLVFVLFIGYQIATSHTGEAVMGWLIFMVVDFPVGYGMIPLAYLIDSANTLSSYDANGIYQIYLDVENFWFPFIYTGVVGTLWWYYVPVLLAKSYSWVKNRVGT
ncbi:hypothetical protein LP316_11290 [Thalassotalea sp. LPB0316]|uniref:hypothetical protein n=1 Tax=Thalassotalea sp. LPB0316 TaxID=2769490 RepID=UPI001866C2AE|nr:hypothetical protein [Thalassotalea sp. LPB0316]QOL24890.1 hypothetical protein LP316_11290 [Thalassotalea sp. LPB0316]